METILAILMVLAIFVGIPLTIAAIIVGAVVAKWKIREAIGNET